MREVSHDCFIVGAARLPERPANGHAAHTIVSSWERRDLPVTVPSRRPTNCLSAGAPSTTPPEGVRKIGRRPSTDDGLRRQGSRQVRAAAALPNAA